MRILLGFDKGLLVDRYRSGRPLVLDLEVEHGDVSYPFRGWSDFGAVIVGWWLARTIELVEGAIEVEFAFMDGPYRIRVAESGTPGLLELRPDGKGYVWSVSSGELIDELIRAAGRIRDELGRLGIGETDRLSLEVGIADLRAAAGR